MIKISITLDSLNGMPAVGVHLTAKFFVDNAIVYSVDELPLLRLDPDEKLKLDDQDSINLNSTLTSLKTLIELPNKPDVDSLHESSKNRPDLLSVFNDQDIEVGNKKLTNLDIVVVNRKPTSDNEVTNEKYVDDSIEEVTILRINQTLEKCLKVSVGNDIYHHLKMKKK